MTGTLDQFGDLRITSPQEAFSLSISDGLSPPKLPQWGRGGGPVTQGELIAALTQSWEYVLEQTEQVTRIGAQIMAVQSDVDALTTELVAEDSALNTAVANLTAADTAIQAEIDALKVANPAIDLTALQAEFANSSTATAAVAAAVAATAALVPAPPAA